MSRSSAAVQIVGLFVTAGLFAVGAMNCGSSGGGDTTGTAGTGAPAGCTLDQVQAIFTSTTGNTGCTVIGACHDNNGAAAGLDLTAGSGWQSKLVGMGPVANKGGGASLYSMCAGMNLQYLKAGSKPAAGLMIDKIDPSHTSAPCGAHMPNLPPPLTTTQFNCVQSYLTTLTSP
jgi:hypothetical protein